MDINTLFSGLALIISALSYIKSMKSLEYSKRKDKENIIISESKYYIDLYNAEYKKIKILTNEISTLCISTNNDIGLLFDEHENNFRLKEIGYKKPLRHIYDYTNELIMNSLKGDFLWQTPENLYSQLAYFKRIDINLGDTKNINENIAFDREIKQGIYMLNKSINSEEQQKFYNEFIIKVLNIVNYFHKISYDIKKSIENLEDGLQDNKIQNFDLRDNIKVYPLYKQLLNFLKLIDKSQINSLLEYDKEPHLPINKMVYIGANMKILNELLCRVSGSYWKD